MTLVAGIVLACGFTAAVGAAYLLADYVEPPSTLPTATARPR